MNWKFKLMKMNKFKSVLIVVSLLVSLCGAIGMIWASPYLLDSDLYTVLAGGLPFLAGVILLIGGLISASILVSKNK